MVEFFIATDEKDDSLGSFFDRCRNDIKNFLEGFEDRFSITELETKLCTEEYIEIALIPKKDIPFIFLTNTHGNEYGVLSGKKYFVQVGGKNEAFNLSLFYANSCLAGLNLGPDLTLNFGCSAFIGYDQPVLTFLDEYEALSIRCFNWGIKFFVSKEGATIQEAFDAMKSEYTVQVNKLFDNRDIIKAGLLLRNRDSLVIYGKQDLTVDHLTN